MNERKTTTLPDGTKVFFIQYDEMPDYKMRTCELCAVYSMLDRSQPCYVNKEIGCGGGLFLGATEFAAARVGVVPSVKVNLRRPV